MIILNPIESYVPVKVLHSHGVVVKRYGNTSVTVTERTEITVASGNAVFTQVTHYVRSGVVIEINDVPVHVLKSLMPVVIAYVNNEWSVI